MYMSFMRIGYILPTRTYIPLVQFLTVASHSYVSIDILYYIPIFYVYFLLVQFLKMWKLAVAFPSYISIDIVYFFLPAFAF